MTVELVGKILADRLSDRSQKIGTVAEPLNPIGRDIISKVTKSEKCKADRAFCWPDIIFNLVTLENVLEPLLRWPFFQIPELPEEVSV